jgi:hypothetical protein
MESSLFKMEINGAASRWHIVETDAPADYDGFGTFTISELGGDTRIVLVRDEHYQWQTARYQSGLHRFEELSDDWNNAVEVAIWKRIAGKAADAYRALKKLCEMHDEGQLTDAEWTAARLALDGGAP